MKHKFNQIPTCPVVHPTESQFSNFYEYIAQLEDQYQHQFGMIKIIPPLSFQPNPDYNQAIKNLMVQGPIQQNVYGRGGHYESLHIQKKSMSLTDYRSQANKNDISISQLTHDQIEDIFWKTIAFSPPLYGADIKISLMETQSSWNYNHLYSLLNEGLNQKISGVNEPYLYVGCWKSFFAWHKEDMDLCSTNYNHLGEPKFWYCIRPDDEYILENYAKQVFSTNFQNCPEFLRHKTIVINPYILKEKFPQIQISKQ